MLRTSRLGYVTRSWRR